MIYKDAHLIRRNRRERVEVGHMSRRRLVPALEASLWGGLVQVGKRRRVVGLVLERVGHLGEGGRTDRVSDDAI